VRLDFIATGKILLAALRSNLPAASEAQLPGAVQVWAFRPSDTRVSQNEKSRTGEGAAVRPQMAGRSASPIGTMFPAGSSAARGTMPKKSSASAGLFRFR
jgi:hypothetical protein